MKLNHIYKIVILLLASFLLSEKNGIAATYYVGPGRTYTNLQAVFDNVHLVGGDIIEVDGDTTYPGGVTIDDGDRGEPGNPIIIRGIRSNNNRPILSGGTNTIHFSTWPPDQPGADHYLLEGFEITGGSSRCVFHQADDLTIRDSVVHGCPGQGILGADQGSGSLTLEYVEVYDSGNGTYEHQIYMATDEVNHPGSVFRAEHCYIHDGNGGNNIKSRAERNEIYYNWIEGAYYHELELIGPDPGGAPGGWTAGMAREDSDVVGNVFRKTRNGFVFRVGGDGTGETDGRYRFVNNTIIADSSAVFRFFDGIESIQMHNNIFYRHGGAVDLQRATNVSWTTGSAIISGSNNWVTENAVDVPSQWTGTHTGSDPGFADFALLNLRPETGSPLLDNGNSNTSQFDPSGYPFPGPLFPPTLHPPVAPLADMSTAEPRPGDGTIDIGAYEGSSGPVTDPPVADFTATPVSGPAPLTVQFTDLSSNSPTSWQWDFDDDGTVDSTERNPQHTYTIQGNYTVSLLAVNSIGPSSEEVTTNYIAVSEPSSEIIIDNSDTEHTSRTGTWSTSSAAGFYGTNSFYNVTPGDTFTFQADASGRYEVSKWWTQYHSRQTNVAIEIYDDNTLLDTVHVNQQEDGGQWNSLGVYDFTSGSAKVVIVSSGDSTCADAVKFVRTTAMAGDVNGNGAVDMEDVILSLQIASAQEAADIELEGDVNGDGCIGLAEAILVLRRVAGLPGQ